jgi:hypothetical protein
MPRGVWQLHVLTHARLPWWLLQVIADYHTPPGKSLQRDLMATINAAVDFLVR